MTRGRPPRPLHRSPHRLRTEDRYLGRGCRDSDVSPRERSGEFSEIARFGIETNSDLLGALLRPVGDHQVSYTATLRCLERLKPDAPGADHQDARIADTAESAVRERERHRARRRRVRPDRSLRARTPRRREGAAEENREAGSGRALLARQPVRLSNLAEDLGFAEHERVETRSDAAEVPCGVLTRVNVEMVDQELARNAVCRRERVDELVAGFLDAGGQSRIQLDAVTRVEHCVLEYRGAALCAKAESADALAQLDRSSAMTEPEADEAVHGGRDPTPRRDRE